MDEQWNVYIVRCADGTLYTGIAKDLKKRLAEHNFEDRGAKYTRSRRPVELVYVESGPSRSAVSKREYQIKRMTVKQKRELISKAGVGVDWLNR